MDYDDWQARLDEAREPGCSLPGQLTIDEALAGDDDAGDDAQGGNDV